MALFAIADTHLSVGRDKRMDVFGSRWQGYMEKLEARWNSVVGESDTVVVPGDISWAMRLDEARSDFEYLERLRGKKIILKGNHDYWWESESKMMRALEEWGVGSVSILSNSAYLSEGKIICGSRGWFIEKRLQDKSFASSYEKMINRECIRLSLSLDAGERIREAEGAALPIYAFLHFPPVFEDFVCEPIIDVLLSRGVRRCYFGHIHSSYAIPARTEYRGLELEIISSDYLDFYPKPVL